MNDDCGNGCGLLGVLCDNINSVVTIATQGGCFTGLLCSVDCDTCRLITRDNRCPGCSCFGKVTIIPTDEICAITLCNTGM